MDAKRKSGPGIYHVTFSVTDGFVSSSETIAVTVTDVNAAPVLDPIGNKSVLEGERITLHDKRGDGDVPARVGLQRGWPAARGGIRPGDSGVRLDAKPYARSTSFPLRPSPLSDGLVTTSRGDHHHGYGSESATDTQSDR